MIKCQWCATEYPDEASYCPNCGRYIRVTSFDFLLYFVFLIIILGNHWVLSSFS